jgi:dihydropteroate synthase
MIPVSPTTPVTPPLRFHPPRRVPAWALRADHDAQTAFSLMGILNVTPDSFSDGGLHASPDAAIMHGLRMEEAGADILDVGGESTRPGAEAVPADEELRRVLPVIEALARRTHCRISVDTRRAEVAAAALAAGAHIINDISAARNDAGMIDVAVAHRCPVILMHMQGTPATMQQQPHYDDVVREVRDMLAERIAVFRAAGLTDLALDPGIGFGKDLEHNLDLLRNVASCASDDVPVVIGTSRKSFLGRLTGTSVDERLPETIASSVAALYAGASIIRVHDVAEVRRALIVAATIAWGSKAGGLR